jgi:hypothetical protein
MNRLEKDVHEEAAFLFHLQEDTKHRQAERDLEAIGMKNSRDASETERSRPSYDDLELSGFLGVRWMK